MSTLNGGTHSGESDSGFDLTRELEESISRFSIMHSVYLLLRSLAFVAASPKANTTETVTVHDCTFGVQNCEKVKLLVSEN